MTNIPPPPKYSLDNLPSLPNLDFPSPAHGEQPTIFKEQFEIGADTITALDAALDRHASAVVNLGENDDTVTKSLHLNRKLPSGVWVGFSVNDHRSADGVRTVTLAYDEGYKGWGEDSRIIQAAADQPAVLEVGKLDKTGSFIPSPFGIRILNAKYWPGNIEAGHPQPPSRLERAGRLAKKLIG